MIVLTPRQKTIVRMLSEGKRGSEIAQDLGIAEITVRKHINDAKARTKSDTLAHLVAISKDEGLI